MKAPQQGKPAGRAVAETRRRDPALSVAQVIKSLDPMLDAAARAKGGPSSFSTQQRDFLLLNIFVLTQHGYIERASLLAEALYLLGNGSPEAVLARTVLRFFSGDWSAALACLEELDRIDPIERFGPYTMNDRQRMRRYLKARCLFELHQHVPARDAVESYLRHGSDGTEDSE
jgi:hypothetical protein